MSPQSLLMSLKMIAGYRCPLLKHRESAVVFCHCARYGYSHLLSELLTLFCDTNVVSNSIEVESAAILHELWNLVSKVSELKMLRVRETLHVKSSEVFACFEVSYVVLTFGLFVSYWSSYEGTRLMRFVCRCLNHFHKVLNGFSLILTAEIYGCWLFKLSSIRGV